MNDAVSWIFCAVKVGLLAGMHFVRFSVGANLACAANHGDPRRVTRFVNVDAKGSGFLNIKNHIRSINFVNVTLP